MFTCLACREMTLADKAVPGVEGRTGGHGLPSEIGKYQVAEAGGGSLDGGLKVVGNFCGEKVPKLRGVVGKFC